MQPTAGGTTASYMMAHDGTSATHASTAALSRQEAHLLPTLTYPRSPSCCISAYTMGHPGLHPDLGSWDHSIDDRCEGCTQWSLGCAAITCARGAQRSLGCSMITCARGAQWSLGPTACDETAR